MFGEWVQVDPRARSGEQEGWKYEKAINYIKFPPPQPEDLQDTKSWFQIQDQDQISGAVHT